MKKSAIIFSIIITSTFLLVSCTKSTETITSNLSSTNLNSIVSSNSSDNASRDLTVKVKTLDMKKYRKQLSSAVQINSAASYRYNASSLELMYQNSTQVIRCQILKTEFTILNDDPYLKADVKILESYKGDFHKNDIISVFTYGGYMPYDEYV